MLGLLYFGRLEKEKGFDGIIEMIELFEKNDKEIPYELFIFGSGSRENKIEELASKHKNIHFFGRKSLETIKRYIGNCSYCLMPSECLESFGLSALNAIQRGLPVIGYAKGGLKDFINNDLDLTHQPGHTTGQKLHKLLLDLPKSPLKKGEACPKQGLRASADADGGFEKAQSLSEPEDLVGNKRAERLKSPLIKGGNKRGDLEGSTASKLAQHYSKESRIVKFHALAGKKVQKIIIVSDFINRIGGIETYINDVKELLEQHGYQVELCGGTIPSGFFGKLMKYLGIISGLGNFYEAIKLQGKINKMKPDLIRYNSVIRYLGRAPLWISKNSPAKKWMMFHDLGYFYPFPSQLSSEHQIKTPLTLKHFLASYPTKNPLKKLAIIGKYISLYFIKNQLQKRIDTLFVPSLFMQDIVHKSYQIDKEKILPFSHFIQK